MSCDNCKYCQVRHVKKIGDNIWRCKIMKFKECYDNALKGFSVYEHTLTWCPINKPGGNPAATTVGNGKEQQ